MSEKVKNSPGGLYGVGTQGRSRGAGIMVSKVTAWGVTRGGPTQEALVNGARMGQLDSKLGSRKCGRATCF